MNSLVTTTRVAPVPATYYRQPYVQQQPPQRSAPTIIDDYERWYTEATPNNRMVLSLKSGIDKEVSWALDRLCRLCDNDLFLLKGIPGLLEALFEWPEWYASEGYKATNDTPAVFAPDPIAARKRRHALESLHVLKNAGLNEPNAQELFLYPRTLPLITTLLENLDAARDSHSEFVLYAVELMQIISPRVVLSSPMSLYNPIYRLSLISSESSNRSLILACLIALYTLLSNPANSTNLSGNAPALEAAIRFLPLFEQDIELVDASLNYLYAHLSNSAMANSFLLRPDMSSVLKLLVNIILYEQDEETVTQDISGTIHTTPSTTTTTRDHELSKDELDALLEMPEPQRCYEWMKTMFVAKPDGELTQVEFWNLYKDIFMQYQDRFPLLVASDVIKNVNFVFPQAQAMVLQGPTQRFVVRGVDRRKETVATERFKCRWDRCQCSAAAFASPGELYDHLLDHLKTLDASPCLWSKCSQTALDPALLRIHVLTHLASSQPPAKDPSQSDTITLPSVSSPYPTVNPTIRPPPPPRKTLITYKRPRADPPSTSLTALLCIRVLFRASYASSEAAPRPDVDHFGFPGVVDENEEVVQESIAGDVEQEAERRGRRAFVGVRKPMEGVQLRNETLMGWVTEMVDAAILGVP